MSAKFENKTDLFFSTADFAGNDLEDVATVTKTRWVDVPSASPQAVALNRRLVVPMERRPGNTLSERSARGAFYHGPAQSHHHDPLSPNWYFIVVTVLARPER